MHKLIVLLAFLPATAQAQNFTGDPEFVAAAEAARTKSSIFWTGKDLPAWSKPCPISWNPRAGVSLTGFKFTGGEVIDFHMELAEPRGRVLSNVIPHEVDHAVRASIVKKKIPRWLDEGCSVMFESDTSKAEYRSALIYGDLRSSAWHMLEMKSYPQTSDELTAFYSGSAAIVEWFAETLSAAELLHLQKVGLATDKQWIEHLGETKQDSRKKFERWFAAKYTQDKPSGRPFIDVWIAGDFPCPPCHSFMEYATSTTFDDRGFEYHIHRVSREDCAKNGLKVPMFSAGETIYSGNLGNWKDIDTWAVQQLGLTVEQPQPPPIEDAPPAPQPAVSQPALPKMPPGVTASPEALAIFAQAMGTPPSPPSPDPEVDWNGITIVVAVSEDVPAVSEAAKGPVRRALKRLTNGKAKLVIISEESNHAKFNRYESELGLDLEMFHVSVLIPEASVSTPVKFAVERLEVIIHNITENFTGEKPRDIPIEPITEWVSPEDYDLVQEIIEDTTEEESSLWDFDKKYIDYVLLLVAGLGVGRFVKRKNKTNSKEESFSVGPSGVITTEKPAAQKGTGPA